MSNRSTREDEEEFTDSDGTPGLGPDDGNPGDSDPGGKGGNDPGNKVKE